MAVAKTLCPRCRRKIELEQVERGEWVSCPYCWADLEVISLNPPVLDWAYDGPEVGSYLRIWIRPPRWAGQQPVSAKRPNES
jgi:lysine biosynthesis protein LysW